MPKIHFNPLVDDTSQRLYGLSALIEMVYEATPGIEQQRRDALKELAQRESWEYGEYAVEDQFLDVKFGYWLPRLAAYSIIVLLSSIVETQLLAFARRAGRTAKSAFEPNELKGSVLERATVYIRNVSGLELTKDVRWKTLKDLQDLRDVIVHRAGRPGEDKGRQFELMCKTYPGPSLDANPYTIHGGPELGITLHSCRYFASEIEKFFKDLFKAAGLPIESGLWPNIQSGFREELPRPAES